MCLFKKDDKENTCDHEGCKNYYLLSKQTCVYPKSTDGETNLRTNKPNNFAGDEQNMLELLQKKIKKDNDIKTSAQERDMQMPMMNPMQGNQSFTINPMFLSQMLQPQIKQEISMPNPSGMLLSFLAQQQNMQPSMQQSMQPSMQQSIQASMPDQSAMMGIPNANLSSSNLSNMSLAQMIKLKNQNAMMNQMANTPKSEAGLEPNQPTDIKEFQSKIFNLVLTQNKILMELKEKHDILQEALKCLITEVATLKSNIKNTIPEGISTASGNTAVYSQIIGNSAETINTDSLLTYLYGPNPEFSYQLVLKQDLPLPLYRERNFKFTILLVDKNGNLVENTNRIPLSIGIYSSENPPKYIDSNTAGNKILKGLTEKDLAYGTASFEKIQIKEVTSHFRNGWVFFVVYPKTASNSNMITVDGNVRFISSQKIRPLILEKVIVKAKKTKEKDNQGDGDDNGPEEAEIEKEEVIYSNN